jgi:hypothetical protein
LLGDERVAAKAAETGKQIREEDALRVACDEIEELLAGQRTSTTPRFSR